MDYIETLENAGDEFINGIRTAQDATLTAVGRVSKAVGGFVPNVAIPLPVELPRATAVAESAFRFWQKVFENQKEFTLKLLEALEPVTPKTSK